MHFYNKETNSFAQNVMTHKQYVVSVSVQFLEANYTYIYISAFLMMYSFKAIAKVQHKNTTSFYNPTTHTHTPNPHSGLFHCSPVITVPLRHSLTFKSQSKPKTHCTYTQETQPTHPHTLETINKWHTCLVVASPSGFIYIDELHMFRYNYSCLRPSRN